MRSINSVIRGISNTYQYVKEPYAFYENIKSNKLVNQDMILGGYFITSSSAAANEVFTAPHEIFAVGDNMQVLLPVLGPRSVFLLAGKEHLAERKMLTQPFTAKSIAGYAHRMSMLTKQNTAAWHPGKSLLIRDMTYKTSLDIIVEVVFGVRESAKAEELGRALINTLDLMTPPLLYFPFLRNSLFRPWRKFKQARRKADELIYRLVEERLAQRNTGEEQDDILSLLLSADGGSASTLPRETIRDHLVTMLGAGHETTGASLAWAIYHILRNPECLRKIREEVDSIPADAPAEAYSKLPYLSAVCNETLRLYPVVLDCERKLLQDWTLLGTHIPKGSDVLVSILNIHRDTALYPEPEQFRPERFIDRTFSPWEFLPFGGGIRRCIGANFATFEMKIVLGTLLREWDLKLSDDIPIYPVRRHITIVPDRGVPVTIVGRREQTTSLSNQ